MNYHFKTLRTLHKNSKRKGNVRSANSLVSNNLYKKLTNLHKKPYIVYKEKEKSNFIFLFYYIYLISKFT